MTTRGIHGELKVNAKYASGDAFSGMHLTDEDSDGKSYELPIVKSILIKSHRSLSLSIHIVIIIIIALLVTSAIAGTRTHTPDCTLTFTH